MNNFENIIWRNSKNLKVNGAAITKGVCRSAEGKEFDFTDDLMTKILSHFNDAVPIKIGHGNTPEVGRAYKMGFDSLSQNLPFEGHIYGDDKRKEIESKGQNKISPEIDFTFDASGVPIDGVITALALVPIPAMEGTQVSCAQMTFSAPDESDHMKQEGIMVFYPKGTEVVTPTVNNVVVEAPIVPVVDTTSAANFEADLKKYKKISADFEAENVALKTETETLKAAAEAEKANLTAQIDEYKSKVDALTNENTGFIKEKTDVVIAELKTLGFKAPETIAADMPAKQRIEVLKQMKSNFVTSAPSDKPTEPIITPPPALTGKAAVMATIPEELRKYIKSGSV
jgi:hypothetical protein